MNYDAIGLGNEPTDELGRLGRGVARGVMHHNRAVVDCVRDEHHFDRFGVPVRAGRNRRRAIRLEVEEKRAHCGPSKVIAQRAAPRYNIPAIASS